MVSSGALAITATSQGVEGLQRGDAKLGNQCGEFKFPSFGAANSSKELQIRTVEP